MAVRLDLTKAGVKLYGRDDELEKFGSIWTRVLNCEGRETVLVHGQSGVGKTRVVQRSLDDILCQNAIKNNSLLVGSGKFDQLKGCRPFSAVVDAVCQILNEVILEASLLEKARERLRFEDVRRIYPFLRALREICPPPPDCDSSFSSNGPLRQNRRSSFTLQQMDLVTTSLKNVIKAIDAPMIMVLDDLQFADASSLDMIVSLATDSEISSFGLALVYRDNDDPMAQAANYWTTQLQYLKPTIVKVENLPVEALAEMLKDLTKREDSEAYLELAEVVHTKTIGNPFYTLQLLEQLQDQALIYYNYTQYRWEWKIGDIRQEIRLSENALSVVLGKLSRMDETMQQFIHLAACFGQRFDIGIIQEIKGTNVSRNLERAVQARLIEKSSIGEFYQWGHDRIQEAAYSSITEPAKLHWEIGLALRPKLLEDSVDESMYVIAVDQINRGLSSRVLDPEDSRSIASLNLVVVQIMMKKSAFYQAIGFLESAITLLGPEAWSENYEDMLELSNCAVKIYYFVGRTEDVVRQAHTHYENAKLKSDKIEMYQYELAATFMGSFADCDQVLDRGIHVINELTGSRVPRHPSMIYLLRKYVKIKRKLSQYSRCEIVTLPENTSREARYVIDIVNLLITACWVGGNSKMLPALCFIAVDLTFKSGLVYALPFSILSILFGAFGDFEKSYEMAEVVMELLPRVPEVDRPRSESCARVFGLSLRLSHHQQIEPSLRLYKTASEVGDNLWASCSIANYFAFYIFDGNLPLGSVHKDADSFVRELGRMSIRLIKDFFMPMIQAVENLHSSSPAAQVKQLEGQWVKVPAYYNGMKKTSFTTYQWYLIMRLFLAVHFQDEQLCLEISRVYWKGRKEPDGSWAFGLNKQFYYGMAAYMIAGSSRAETRKWYHRGWRLEKGIEKQAKLGNVNATHLALILAAERKSLKGETVGVVKAAFDQAIAMSSRAGFLADGGLANHRAGLYFKRKGHSDLCTSYLHSSVSLYRRWEARAVALHIGLENGLDSSPSERSQQLSLGCSSSNKQRHASSVLASMAKSKLDLSNSLSSLSGQAILEEPGDLDA